MLKIDKVRYFSGTMSPLVSRDGQPSSDLPYRPDDPNPPAPRLEGARSASIHSTAS